MKRLPRKLKKRLNKFGWIDFQFQIAMKEYQQKLEDFYYKTYAVDLKKQ